MSVDIASLVILLLFFVRGYMKGLIVAAFSVIAILLGLLVALKLSQSFAAWLLAHDYISTGWAQVVSYVVLFVGVVILVKFIARIIQKAAEGLLLGQINKLLGGLLYAFMGAVVWSSVLWIGERIHLFSAETIASSVTYASLSQLAPWFWEQAGKLLPFVQDTFTKLDHFFDTINQQASDVGTD